MISNKIITKEFFMELVYLWVDKYKNIEKQGFNFSPRFRCKYDEEKNELEIIDKDETGEFYPKNFFGDNINVTAIVGENGSGKSSILNSLIYRLNVMAVVSDDELSVHSKKIIPNTKIVKKILRKELPHRILYYSMDRKTHLNDSYCTFVDINKIPELIAENYLLLQNQEFNIFNFKPYYTYFEYFNNWLSTDVEIDELDISNIKLVLGEQIDSNLILNTIKVMQNINDDYLKYLLSKFITIRQIFENINLIEKFNQKTNILILSIEEVQKALKLCDINFIEKRLFDLIIEQSCQYLEIENLRNIFGDKYLKIFFDEMNEYLSFDFLSENEVTFNSLSHGEKTIYGFFINLVIFDRKEFLFLLDEPDNTLHPEWQRSFLNEIINLIKLLKKKVHIIVTSHSPFLLSDLPKENIIFLEKGKQVYPFDDGKQTFGANIHTLLSHGFFMKNGLMGEFAKSKIDDVINYLNNKESEIKNDEDAQNIIDIIGEPIIKRELQRMLKNKMELSNKTEIDTIKDEIKLLTKRLEDLEKDDK